MDERYKPPGTGDKPPALPWFVQVCLMTAGITAVLIGALWMAMWLAGWDVRHFPPSPPRQENIEEPR